MRPLHNTLITNGTQFIQTHLSSRTNKQAYEYAGERKQSTAAENRQ